LSPQGLARGLGFAFLTFALVAPQASAEDRSAVPLEHGADLGSRLSRGVLVLHAEVTRDGGKSRLQLLEPIRGEAPAELVVDSRQSNAIRDLDTQAFRTVKGEQAVFVLRPYKNRREDVRLGVFEPAAGGASKIAVPVEGAEALFDAIREIVAFQDAADRGAAEARLIDWIGDRNPWLVDFALDQGSRYGVVDEEWIAPLLRSMRDPSPWRRLTALAALGEAFAMNRFARDASFRQASDALLEESSDSLRAAREEIVRLARSDPDDRVRREAVRRVAASGFKGAGALLESISRDDASQDVRYEAAVELRRFLKRHER